MPKNSGGALTRLGSYVDEFKSSPFLKHNLIFFSGSLAVAVLNYLFYPVLSRLLKPADFGEVQTLTSLFTQAAIFLTILSYVTIHVTVNITDESERNRKLLGLERLAILGGYVFLFIALLGSEKLRVFLHFRDVWPFVALIAALAVSIPLAFRMAFLRGRKQFVKASLTDGIGSAAKLILAPILVLAGWRSFGAITALALSQIISLMFGLAWARQAGFLGFGVGAKSAGLAELKPQLRHGLAVLSTSGCVTILQTLDIVTIKHYFPPVQAGLYAGITTVAGIIFFLMSPITGVLVTSVSSDQPASQNRLRLKGSLALMVGLGGTALAVMALLPEFVIRLLVGGKYLTYAHYLPRIGLIMLLLAVGSAITMYHIALKHYYQSISAVAALILTFGLLCLKHDTILMVINDLLAGGAALLVLTTFQDFLLHYVGRKGVNV